MWHGACCQLDCGMEAGAPQCALLSHCMPAVAPRRYKGREGRCRRINLLGGGTGITPLYQASALIKNAVHAMLRSIWACPVAYVRTHWFLWHLQSHAPASTHGQLPASCAGHASNHGGRERPNRAVPGALRNMLPAAAGSIYKPHGSTGDSVRVARARRRSTTRHEGATAAGRVCLDELHT